MNVQWRHPQPDIWVAIEAGRPIGIVSRKGRRAYLVTAVSGRSLGLHDTFERAQAVLTAAQGAAAPAAEPNEPAGTPLPG